VRFVQTTITGFDVVERCLLTEAGHIPYDLLVLALGSRPNDFGIPGLAERVLSPYSAEEAQRVWDAVIQSVRQAAAASDPQERQRLMTIVIGGGGATGVELAGGFAEELPELARRYGAPPELARVILVEAGHTILAGSSPQLVARATDILRELRVDVRTNTAVAAAMPNGFRIKSGEVIQGGVFIWAGGVKAPELVRGSGLPVGYNGRVKVDEYLRAIGHPDIFVAGDLASVVDAETGHALPVLAQVAVQEGAQPARDDRGPLARAVHLPGQGIRGLRRGPQRRGGGRRDNVWRAARARAQRRHRMGVSADRQAPPRLRGRVGVSRLPEGSRV
jgi:NADH dehydrogenase